MAHAAYIVSTDYTTTYKGTAIPAADFDRIALRASEAIDEMTMNEIRKAGISTFSAEDQEAIKLATCVIAENFAQAEALSGGAGAALTSEKVGSYSYTVDTGAVIEASKAAHGRAEGLLLYTGLLYRALGRWA